MRVETLDNAVVAPPIGALRPPVARRPIVSPGAALHEEIRDSVRLLAGCLGATGVLATLLHFMTVWAG